MTARAIGMRAIAVNLALGSFGCRTPGGPGGEPPAEATNREPCRVDVTCYGPILDDPKAPCRMQVYDSGGALQVDSPAGIELRGRSSLVFPKPQYAVELRQHTELPVWPGARWRALADGTDPGPAWKLPGFDDGAWAEGPAPLGSGAPYLQTELPARALTTLYRGTFTLQDPAAVTDLEVGLKRIDGVAVYVNGHEVARDNLPEQAGVDTPALAPSPDLSYWRSWDIDIDLLVPGENLIAVEVHRASLDGATWFDLYLEAEGDGAAVDLLGMGAESDWILNGQYVDRVLWRNRLAYDLYQSFGGKDRYATETRFCEMHLNGEYAGIYTLGESIERDEHRLDIGSGDRPGDTFLVKNDDIGERLVDNAVGYGFWQLEYPDPEPEAVAEVTASLERFSEAVNGPSFADPDEGLFAHLDLAGAVDWVLLAELMKNRDAYLLSVHLVRDQDEKMRFVPWDFDLSLGSYPFTDCSPAGWVPRTWLAPGGEELPIALVQRMAETPAFREALAERWWELREGPLAEDALFDRIAEYDATLAPLLDANLERWPVEDVVFSTPGVDDWLCPRASYEAEHEAVTAFLHDRLVWIDENVDAF